MKLKSPVILPIAERDIGKKFCFKVDSGKRSYYLCAASAKILMKWLKAIQEASKWYESSPEKHAGSMTPGDNISRDPYDDPSQLHRQRSYSASNLNPKPPVEKRKRSPIAWHLSLTSKLVKQQSIDNSNNNNNNNK